MRQIKWRVLANIGSGWVSTPLIAAAISFFFLFFLQNVFQQQVYKEVRYELSDVVVEHVAAAGVPTDDLEALRGKEVASAVAFSRTLREQAALSDEQVMRVVESAEVHGLAITAAALSELDREFLGPERAQAVEALADDAFTHRWQLRAALEERSEAWRKKDPGPLTDEYNKQLGEAYDYAFRHFHVED